MSAYVPSAFVDDCPDHGHCLQCLTITLTVMTTILQLHTGSCIKLFLFTNKGSTYKCRNRNNRDRTHLIPALQNLRRRRYVHTQEDWTNWIPRRDSNREIATTEYKSSINKITRTLWDINTQKGWHSIWPSPFATYDNKKLRSKTAQTTLHGRRSIQATPLAANKDKTSNLKINQAQNKPIMQEYTCICEPRSKSQLRSPINHPSQ